MKYDSRAIPRCMTGHTLLEMMLSLVLLSIVMASVGSAVMFASQAIPDEESPVGSLLSDSSVLSRIAEDLALAQYIIEKTDRAITVVVPDRTGDNIPDRIRYAWSGTYGEPLFFQLNDEAASIVIQSVATFSLVYTTSVESSLMPTATYFADESVIDSYTTLGSGSDRAVSKDASYGQIVTPRLSAASIGFRPTRVSLYASNKTPTDGQFLLELRDRLGAIPGNVVYATDTLSERTLPDAKAWNSFTMSHTTTVKRDQDIALVFEHVSGENEAILIGEDSVSGGLLGLGSGNGGQLHGGVDETDWVVDDGKTFLYQVFGRELLPDTEQYTTTQQHVTMTSVSLQRVATDRSVLSRNVQMLLAPSLLTAFATADFDADPTAMDLDANGRAEWVHSSGSFSNESINQGIWTSSGKLAFQPDGLSNADVISVSARMRSNDTLGPTIYGPYTFNLAGELLPIITQLRVDDENGQELVIYNDTTMSTPFAVIQGLPGGLIDVRLVVIPDEDYLMIEINHEPRVAFLLDRMADPGTVTQSITFGSAGGSAAFSSISIRVGGSSSSADRSDIDGLIPNLLDVLF